MTARAQREGLKDTIHRRSTVVALLALAALGILFVRHGELNADEGFYLLASRFVTEGLRPFRDFGFTQTPLVAYANIPWLALFGYDLAGVRLAGFAWTTIAVVLGAWTLRRRSGWAVVSAFALLLAAGPTWLAFATKGKTYAFASLAVLVGTIAMTATQTRWWWRWAVFIAAAATAVAARLPAAGFFLPAGIFLLVRTPGWRARTLAGAAVVISGAAVLALATGGDWDNFWFWTAEFHAASTIRPSWDDRLLGSIAIAPALWLVLALGSATARSRIEHLAVLSLLIGILANVVPPSGYSEYITIFIPALALLAAPTVVNRAREWRPSVITTCATALLAAGWVRPPPFDRGVLQQAADASAFLRAQTTPEDKVVASMPEIVVAAERSISPRLTMGKFAITESLAADEADRRLMLTPATLVELIEDPASKALVLSAYKRWNFSWSVPDYHYLSGDARSTLFSTIQREYELAHTNDEYVIFSRKKAAAGIPP